MDEGQFLATLTRVIGAFNYADVPFAVAGGGAVYAHGGPYPGHDIDVLVTPDGAEFAAEVLAAAGMSRVRPPEDWLLKVYDDDVLVDLVHHLNERPVTPEDLAGAEPIRVGSLSAPVISATELMVDKLAVLNSHRCDFADLLLIARILREQVDWALIRWRTRNSPFAHAFLHLLSKLGVVDSEDVHDLDAPAVVSAQPANGHPPCAAVSVRRMLAEDPLVDDLGVDIDIDRDRIRLAGTVTCQQRKENIELVVAQSVALLPVVNDIEVVELGAPDEPDERVPR
jgi:hypothetical protein